MFKAQTVFWLTMAVLAFSPLGLVISPLGFFDGPRGA